MQLAFLMEATSLSRQCNFPSKNSSKHPNEPTPYPPAQPSSLS
jgi:hypothetical protein